MSNMTCITFEALDSLFFREAKPFNAGEGGFLDSQFPPPAQTLSGAIRTAIGEAAGIDWKKPAIVEALLGTANNPAPLSFAGPYLLRDGKRLYPMPLNLLYSEKAKKWTRLIPSKTTYKTDMGDRVLPKPEKPEETLGEGAKPIESGWLDAANMQKVVNGGLPTEFISEKDIFIREARAGIARDNQKSVVKVKEGSLYFTRHIRLKEDITLAMGISGADQKLPNEAILRLGGEGRLAHMSVDESAQAPLQPTDVSGAKGLVLTLLTHGDFDGEVIPDWQAIHPKLELFTACIGKTIREGGWDYARRRPKPLKSLVPAGSCYFFKVKGEAFSEVIVSLQHKQIGKRKTFGYGEIAVGLWK